MIKETTDFLRRFALRNTAKPVRRIRKLSHSYDTLERRQVLTSIILPEATTNLDVFRDSTENAIVRVDDDSQLVIRTTGEENYVEINLDWGQIRVNPTQQEPVLAIDIDRYDRILVIGEGEDKLVVVGDGLRAQLHPQRTWINTDNYFRQAGQELTIQGINLEDVEIRDIAIPFEAQPSNNVVRMFGSDDSDHLTMTGSNSATMIGEGYKYQADSLERLFAFANGGENFASVVGTRELPNTGEADFSPNWHCAVDDAGSQLCFPFRYGDGVDQFYAADNFSNLQNSTIDARFVDFGTTRVDLLSGVDQVHVQDTEADSSWYRVDGESLVGSNRRFINAERITIDGEGIDNDQLQAPDLLEGDFETVDDESNFSFIRDVTIPLAEGEEQYEGLGQVFPNDFYWKWTAFEEVIHTEVSGVSIASPLVNAPGPHLIDLDLLR